MSFTKFTRKYIFEPLEMGSTQYTRPSDGTAAELYETTKKSGYEYETHPGAYCYPDLYDSDYIKKEYKKILI